MDDSSQREVDQTSRQYDVGDSRAGAGQILRETVAAYDVDAPETAERLTDLPILAGHRPLRDLPTRGEVYEEIFGTAGPLGG